MPCDRLDRDPALSYVTNPALTSRHRPLVGTIFWSTGVLLEHRRQLPPRPHLCDPYCAESFRAGREGVTTRAKDQGQCDRKRDKCRQYVSDLVFDRARRDASFGGPSHAHRRRPPISSERHRADHARRGHLPPGRARAARPRPSTGRPQPALGSSTLDVPAGLGHLHRKCSTNTSLSATIESSSVW
jgi:hypothetical protein